MGDNTAPKNQQAFDHLSINVPPQGGSEDGRLKRTGTVWTASAHILIAAIGSGVLSLAWATTQLGWIAGPATMLFFAIVTYYTSTLLAACYPTGDPDTTRERNYTYMDAVRSNLRGFQVKICEVNRYLNLFGVAIGYTIAASISLMAIKRSNFMILSPPSLLFGGFLNSFGLMGGLFGCDKIGQSRGLAVSMRVIWWLPFVAVFLPLTYSMVGLGLGMAKVAETGKFRGSLTGIGVGTVTQTQKVWRSFQALGDIAFAYSSSLVLIEIQDSIKSSPSQAKTMKKAILISAIVTTIFNMSCGCFGYAAFGDQAPKNLLTGFGFYNPYWLLDIGNLTIIIHLVGSYQVYCQPLFAFVEKTTSQWFPESAIIRKEIEIPTPGFRSFKLSLFRLVWRSMFVVITTIISMIIPFFNDVVGIVGAFGFWPLTVYFPVEMFIVQKKIPKWSRQWLALQILSVVCLMISIAAAAGSFAGLASDLKSYKPFQTRTEH